jgi:AhpD family alkylhydroperoxidase
MSTTTSAPSPRISIPRLARDAYRAQVALDRSIELDPALRELLKMRASIVNGCAYCIDMHAREAHELGETEQRLLALAGWRESPLFSARERAALAVCDAVTLIHRDGLPDDVYAGAQAEFDDEEIAQLILAVAAINTWNRIAISAHSVYPDPWPEG